MRRLVAAAFAAGGAAQAAAAAGPPPELVGHAATPLLDGCTHAFLDLGANAGVQTRKLHQPKLYARSSFVPLFQKAGFYKDGAVRCAVGVEPAREYLCGNQTPCVRMICTPVGEYWPRLREIAVRFQKRGMRTTFVLGGIGVANGTACFAGGRRTGHIHRYTDEGRCGRGMVATPVWDVADLLKRYFFQKSLRAVVAKVDLVKALRQADPGRVRGPVKPCAVSVHQCALRFAVARPVSDATPAQTRSGGRESDPALAETRGRCAYGFFTATRPYKGPECRLSPCAGRD